MKKIVFFLFLYIGIFIPAQNTRIIYDYQFLKDSTDTNSKIIERMVLDIYSHHSKFYSEAVAQSDSLRFESAIRQMKTSNSITITSDMKKGEVRDKIAKYYPHYVTFLHTRVGGTSYKVKDERKLHWHLTSETKKVNNWEVQKAKVTFAGRNWEAWFTKDIPLQEGPYKFHGLPGLIVEMEDTTKTHRFSLVEIKPMIKIELDKNPTKLSKNSVEITLEKFKEQFQKHRKDPTIVMRMDTGKIFDANGNPLDINKIIREREHKMKEKIKKENNHIERDLLY